MIAWSAHSVLLHATLVTAQLFAMSAVVAVILALVFGLALNSTRAPIRVGARIWCELFQGVSLTVQLFWFFFVLPLFGVTLPAVGAAVVALGICFGAYGADTVRSALQAVPRGQWEGAAALGLRPVTTFTSVILPQAFRIMLPGLGNLALLILKSTSVTALITIPELSFQAAAITNNFGASISVFAYVIFAYYAMAKIVIAMTRQIERLFAIP
ncbi:MAG TPA: amino acid ABC transporter permease [Bradyrhizobium sp.]|nr:amino acid ABC transporter permease [Bradyrhizobium sp.]